MLVKEATATDTQSLSIAVPHLFLRYVCISYNSQYWHGAVGILRGLSYITNIMVADDLTTYWARASANMLLASISNNIPVSVP